MLQYWQYSIIVLWVWSVHAEANLQAQSLPDLKSVSSPSPWDCENLPLEKMSCHVPPDSCWVVCDMDAAHTRGHGKIYVLTEDRCFASDRQQLRR